MNGNFRIMKVDILKVGWMLYMWNNNIHQINNDAIICV